MSWQYTVGFSTKDINEKLLGKSGFSYKKVIVEDVLRKAIQECIGALYKNPSSMRIDAPKAFSCSSLISYIYTQAGVWMPSISVDKYVFGTLINENELMFGDLVFSNTGEGRIYRETVEYKLGTKVPEGVDHVAFYLGNGEILHASKSLGKVGIEKLSEAKSLKNIVGFRRVADIKEERLVIDIPEDRRDLRNQENLMKEIAKYARSD